MKGIDLTDAQLAAAKRFVKGREKGNLKTPKDQQIIAMSYIDVIRLVAWYGAIRYTAATQGIGTLTEPGPTAEVERKHDAD